MPAIASQKMTDPLRAFVAGAFASGSRRPVPLVSTAFEVTLDAGLAVVTTKRIFRNDEPASIEATITFPVPVHATLFALEARIGGRVLKAQARSKTVARANYEDALDRGKSAVLHEELLRGVHMLSVGHIAPGAEIEISASWGLSLTMIGGRGHLRIPLTVGDVYGCSALPESDDLIHGGPVQTAALTVRCASGSVSLAHGRLENDRAEVPLNAPIDLVVADWMPRELTGRAAGGRAVTLRIDPQEAGEAALDLAILIDHSGSMNEACSRGGSFTKHQAVRSGLETIASKLRDDDAVALWEFDDALNPVGATREAPRGRWFGTGRRGRPGDRLRDLVQQLAAPSGGTEIGAALGGAAGSSEGRDVLLVTDGKSHALDVQALARMGKRISVVLIGEDSLEANVGYLAALTGGEIFIASGDAIGGVLAASIGTLRRPRVQSVPVKGDLREVRTNRGGALLTAEWGVAAGLMVTDEHMARAVGAVAASLALPLLDTQAATALAEAEGLVSHLTSLVLVDEAGETQDAVPASRKVPLPSPAISARLLHAQSERISASVPRRISRENDLIHPRIAASIPSFELGVAEAAPVFAEDASVFIHLPEAANAIDWDKEPGRLLAGDLSGLDRNVRLAVEDAAARKEVRDLADKLGIAPVLLVLTFLARAAKGRTCERFIREALRRTALGDLIDRLRDMDSRLKEVGAHIGLDGTGLADFSLR
jgi:hypothetical protein